ncbi:hypothetical protein, partial [Escherichia coli]|uniref:hypothetical protein n=1 Tax=Escherichia coli TaxID=562 RepID=UPI0017B6329D
ASPQFDPDGPDADISLVQALSTALSTAVAAGGTPTASVTIHATAPANAWLAESAAHGKLIREVPGVSTTAVDAAPAALALAPPYAAERPSRVIADLRIKYAGVRLVSDYSDLVPAAGAPAGRIVGMAGQERALPPEALRGQRVARLGLRGIASEPTELAGELVDALDGKPLGRAAVLQCAAGPMGDLWAELPEPVVLDRAALVRVRANTGRFLWADGSA